jgi:hypothetical protein
LTGKCYQIISFTARKIGNLNPLRSYVANKKYGSSKNDQKAIVIFHEHTTIKKGVNCFDPR